MIPGPKPHPTWRKDLDGNPGKRARNREEPQLPASAEAWLIVPPQLKSATAIAEWERLAPMLYAARQITDGDRSTLIALCLEWGRYLDALDRATSIIVLTPSGFPMPNPYGTAANQALKNCTRLWPELGLTPSSRSRVRVSTPDDADPFAEFDLPRPPQPS
jgi:P27 family predicted phage terminase small subunit